MVTWMENNPTVVIAKGGKKEANARMKYPLILQMKSFAILVHPPVSTMTNN